MHILIFLLSFLAELILFILLLGWPLPYWLILLLLLGSWLTIFLSKRLAIRQDKGPDEG